MTMTLEKESSEMQMTQLLSTFLSTGGKAQEVASEWRLSQEFIALEATSEVRRS